MCYRNFNRQASLRMRLLREGRANKRSKNVTYIETYFGMDDPKIHHTEGKKQSQRITYCMVSFIGNVQN